jgi:hypothetical protein
MGVGFWILHIRFEIVVPSILKCETYIEIQLAKSKTFTRLIVESDFKLLVDMVIGSC